MPCFIKMEAPPPCSSLVGFLIFLGEIPPPLWQQGFKGKLKKPRKNNKRKIWAQIIPMQVMKKMKKKKFFFISDQVL